MARQKKAGGERNGSAANLGFEAKLWLTADKLRNNMDAAEYKHVVLGLIFLKYISDTFEEKTPRANWGGISSFKITLPPKPIATTFTRNIRLMLNRIIHANLNQARPLATLRDAPLPKLMSGGAQLKDARMFAETLA